MPATPDAQGAEVPPGLAPPPTPAPAQPVAIGPIVWEGSTDLYYMLKLTAAETTEGVVNSGRAFDTATNSFNLNYAEVVARLDANPVGFRIDLGYGHTAYYTEGGAPTAPSRPLFTLQQAYASAKLGMFTLDAGKFVTSAGAEVIESHKNWNYSRSFLFAQLQPFVHTGLRARAALTDALGLELSVTNGWNNDPEVNGAKTLGLSAAFAPMPSTSLTATSYVGKENPAADDIRLLVDVVATHALTSALALNLNFDFLVEGDTNAVGASLMGRLGLLEHLNLAARGELGHLKTFNAQGNLFSYNEYEVTLTAGVPWHRNFEARAELRGDFASESVFYKGVTVPNVSQAQAKSSQLTALIAFLAFLP